MLQQLDGKRDTTKKYAGVYRTHKHKKLRVLCVGHEVTAARGAIDSTGHEPADQRHPRQPCEDDCRKGQDDSVEGVRGLVHAPMLSMLPAAVTPVSSYGSKAVTRR